MAHRKGNNESWGGRVWLVGAVMGNKESTLPGLIKNHEFPQYLTNCNENELKIAVKVD